MSGQAALPATLTQLLQRLALPAVDAESQAHPADGTFARPSMHPLATAASYALVERYRRELDPGYPNESVVATDAIVVRARPAVCPGFEQASTAGDRRRYFLVTSLGLAGSAWLASSLNLHPAIACAMGVDHPLVSMQYYYNADLIQAKTDAVRRPEEIRHGFYSKRLRALFHDRFWLDLVRENPVRHLQHMYDELEWFAPDAVWYGNVHVCSAVQAREYLRDAPTRRDVRVLNLIRHPLPRTEAAIKADLLFTTAPTDADSEWQAHIPALIEEFFETNTELRREVERRFDVDFRDVRNRAVLYSYYGGRHNEAWMAEITQAPDVCHVLLERLMADRDYFAWLLWEITGREIAPSPEFLDQIYTEQHLQSGRHLGHGRALGPRDQWDAWTDWERHEFRQAVRRLDLASVYAPFGYDFSFVG